MGGQWILQRRVDRAWIDGEKFETEERAVQARGFDTANQKARIHGRGGSGYTMERPQMTRVIKVVDQ